MLAILRAHLTLGRCPRCMRTAFLAAFAAWIAALGGAAMGSILVPPLVAVAVALAALWVAHLVAFGWRGARAPVSAACGDVDTLGALKPVSRSRREAALVFCKWVAFAALATAISPSAALAAGRILAQEDSTCPDGYPLACPGTDTCCPTGTPYLCQNLQCTDPDGRVPVGWSGCVNPTTEEHLQWWSQCCAIWVHCG